MSFFGASRTRSGYCMVLCTMRRRESQSWSLICCLGIGAGISGVVRTTATAWAMLTDPRGSMRGGKSGKNKKKEGIWPADESWYPTIAQTKKQMHRVKRRTKEIYIVVSISSLHRSIMTPRTTMCPIPPMGAYFANAVITSPRGFWCRYKQEKDGISSWHDMSMSDRIKDANKNSKQTRGCFRLHGIRRKSNRSRVNDTIFGGLRQATY